jgi:Helitron helicase-like domain at N-terminus
MIDKYLSASGVPCLRVKGSIYHNIGSLFPLENERPKFLQIFFHADDEDIDVGNITELEKQLLLAIREEIKRENPFVRVLSDIIRTTGVLQDPNAIANFSMTLSNVAKDGEHQGRYNLPTSTCVSAIMLGNEECNQPRRRDVVIHLRSRYPEKISCLHSSYDPLAYVLTHMKGDAGWTYSIEENNDEKGLTLMQYYKYRAHTRDLSTGDIKEDILFVGGRLMHQYWVDQWLKIEENRLEYIRKNQKLLKAESYDVIRTAVERNETDIGNWVILPSSHIGSARNNVQNFQDLLAIQRKNGKPDLFITFTCNPQWKEIIENLKPNEMSWMRPDLSSRVFNMKIESLIKDICDNKVF